LENAYRVQFGDQSFHCSGYLQNGYLHATIDGHKTRTPLAGNKQAMTLLTSEQTIECGLVQADLGLNEQQLSDADYQAPINGTIVTLLVSTDEQVKANQPLIVIEAMKMEHSIKAHADGKVSAFFCEPGELVDSGALLLEFESDSI
jgi:3-methylcrotonyl-CoA carboxylase alpha subunit